ncbi:MAG: oligosaccharide repeat unit polymerase [Clostridiales bacterium]|nr:oligosaccharide repeat unit polymerase [Clostridiales bacterium]
MAVILGLFLSALYFLFAFSGRRNVFSPVVIYNLYAWLRNVPHFMQVYDDYDEGLCFKYFIIKVISCLCINMGMLFYERFFSKKYTYVYSDERTMHQNRQHLYYYAGLILLFFGVVIRIYIIVKSGGLIYLLSNLQSRRTLLSGTGYASTISGICINCAVILIEYHYFKNKSAKNGIVFWFSFVIAVLFLIVFGARKPALMLAMKVIICYHFVERKIKFSDLIKPRAIIAFVAVIMFMVMIPMLRYRSTATAFLNPLEWIRMGAERIGSIFEEFSYLSGDMYVFRFFNYKNYWLGKNYLSIPVQWIPSSIFKNKPPMDDGMYLFNMMNGVDVNPLASTVSLPYQTSVPFTTEGILYMNFGYLGLIFITPFIGAVYQYAYKVMKDTGYCIFMIVSYQVIVFEFVPSVLHMTSPLISVLFTWIILYFTLRFRIRRKANKTVKITA